MQIGVICKSALCLQSMKESGHGGLPHTCYGVVSMSFEKGLNKIIWASINEILFPWLIADPNMLFHNKFSNAAYTPLIPN